MVTPIPAPCDPNLNVVISWTSASDHTLSNTEGSEGIPIMIVLQLWWLKYFRNHIKYRTKSQNTEDYFLWNTKSWAFSGFRISVSDTNLSSALKFNISISLSFFIYQLQYLVHLWFFLYLTGPCWSGRAEHEPTDRTPSLCWEAAYTDCQGKWFNTCRFLLLLIHRNLYQVGKHTSDSCRCRNTKRISFRRFLLYVIQECTKLIIHSSSASCYMNTGILRGSHSVGSCCLSYRNAPSWFYTYKISAALFKGIRGWFLSVGSCCLSYIVLSVIQEYTK